MKRLRAGVVVVSIGAGVFAQYSPQEQLDRGRIFWNARLSRSAIGAFEAATRDRSTAAEALEALGRIYTFKGWRQENLFPGWHDEPAYRERALETLKAAVAADPNRPSARDALREAETYAAADTVDPAPVRLEIQALDARIEALRSSPDTPNAEIYAAVRARARAQSDPAPLFNGAQILIDRGEYDLAIDLADYGRTASDHFIDENSSAYQMTGKLQGAYARGRAAAADLIGWALFNKHDLGRAAERLEEAERLFQGQDFVNQYRLAELARARGNQESARSHYLDGLALSGGAPPLRARAKETLRELQSGKSATEFEAWLEGEIARRREVRRVAALASLVDRRLPRLPLTTIDGRPFDQQSLQNKVVLLNFFASWCGICRAELPHLKTAYAKYQHDPGVAFLLVSIDEDSQRLQRFLSEMKFPFPVARLAIDDAEQAMRFDNVPSTFYVDRDGFVRYQITGVEPHGDSPARIGWFIEQVRTTPH